MNHRKFRKITSRLLAFLCAFVLLLTSVDGRIYAMNGEGKKKEESRYEISPEGKQQPLKAGQVLSVAEAMKVEKNQKFIMSGYIVGSFDNGKLLPASATQSAFDIALADSKDEKDTSKIMSVGIGNTDYRKALNLKDNPSNLGRKVKLTGTSVLRFQRPGMSSITACEFLTAPTPVETTKTVTYKVLNETTSEEVKVGEKPTSVPNARYPHKVTSRTWSTITGWHIEGQSQKVNPAETVITEDTTFVADTINKDELRVIDQSYFRSGFKQYTGISNPEIYDGFANRVSEALNSTTMTQDQVDALVKEFRDLQRKEILGNNIRVNLLDENKKTIKGEARVELQQNGKTIDTLEVSGGTLTTQKRYPNGTYTVVETKAPVGYKLAPAVSVEVESTGALNYREAHKAQLIHKTGIFANFAYQDAPNGLVAPEAMEAQDGKITLPTPDVVNKDGKTFLFWMDEAGKVYQPGAEVALSKSQNFVGKWGQSYWKVAVDILDAEGNRIENLDIEGLGLTFSLVDSQGKVHTPSTIDSSRAYVLFFNGNGNLIRDNYKLVIDNSESEYEVAKVIFGDNDFDLKKDVISVPGADATNDSGTQRLEVRIKKSEVKATFTYKDAPEGLQAPESIKPVDGKITLPTPDVVNKDGKSFLFWKDEVGKKYQPGAAIELNKSQNFVGEWGQSYWKVIVDLRDADGKRIENLNIEALGLSFSLVDSRGKSHRPWEISSSKADITFFNKDGNLIRDNYKLVVDDTKSEYEVAGVNFEGKPFDLDKDVISVPGSDSLTDTSAQQIEVRIQKSEVKATFTYEGAPDGVEAPEAIKPMDGKITLPTPDVVNKDGKTFLFWKDEAGKVYQPGAEVALSKSQNFVGNWGKSFWTVIIDLRDADGKRIENLKIEELNLTFSLVDSQGKVHSPSEISSNKADITFFNKNGNLIRDNYKLVVDTSKSEYEVAGTIFEGKPFDLEKDVISVPGSDSLTDTSAQRIEVRIQKSEVKATFTYENAPEGLQAPESIKPVDGKITLPTPDVVNKDGVSFLYWKDEAGKKHQPGAEVELNKSQNFVGKWGKNYWKVFLNIRYENGERILDQKLEDLGLKFFLVGEDKQAHEPWEINSGYDRITFFKNPDQTSYFIRGDYKLVVDDSESEYEVKEVLQDGSPFDLEKDVISVPGPKAMNESWWQSLEVRIQKKKEAASIPVRVEVREDGKRVDSVGFQLQVKVNDVWTDLENTFSYNDYKQGVFENPLLEGEYRLKAKGVPAGKKLVLQSSTNNTAKEIAGLEDTFSLLINEENKGSLSAIWAMFDLVADDSEPGEDPSKPGTDPSKPGTDPSKPGTDPSKPGTDPSKPGTDPSKPGTDPSKPGTDPSKPGTDPSKPGTDPSKPGTDPSKPGTDPSKPGTDPSKPGTEPSKPGTEPSTKPDIKPSEKDQKPGQTTGDDKAEEYYLRFKFGGYTNAKGEKEIIIKCKKGDYIIIPEGPVREGYTFLYWKGSKYYPGDKYLVLGDHDFTAIWAKNDKSVKPAKSIGSKNHGSGSPSTGDFSLVAVAGLGILAACGLVILKKKKETL